MTNFAVNTTVNTFDLFCEKSLSSISHARYGKAFQENKNFGGLPYKQRVGGSSPSTPFFVHITILCWIVLWIAWSLSLDALNQQSFHLPFHLRRPNLIA
jgi:hypothetical protein